MVLTKQSFALCAGILLFLALACQSEVEKSPERQDYIRGVKNKDAPKTGAELIDLLMDKATERASLTPEDQPIVRKIFEDSYTTKFGDLSAPINPDSLKKYMKVERKAE